MVCTHCSDVCRASFGGLYIRNVGWVDRSFARWCCCSEIFAMKNITSNKWLLILVLCFTVILADIALGMWVGWIKAAVAGFIAERNI